MLTIKKLFFPGIIIVALIIFTLGAILLKGKTSVDTVKTLLSVSSFLFGIFVAFSIANSTSRFNKTREVLKTDNAILLFLYQASDIFKPEVKQKVQELIDNYLVDQIDYYLTDFQLSAKSFNQLFQYVIRIETKNQTQREIKKKIIDLSAESFKNRKLVETLVQESMQKYEWASILTLLPIILFCIFYININEGALILFISSILLTTATFTLVFTLNNLDRLQWKEKIWIWAQLENLFLELDLLPYYPAAVIKTGRAKPKKGRNIRLAHYPNPYPDMTGKTVELVKI